MMKKRNIIISVIISLVFLALGAVFWQSYLRFVETCRDLGLSAAYYFCELFSIDYSFTPTVTQYSAVMQWDVLLPSDFASFTDATGRYFSLLISGENFSGYWESMANGLEGTAKILVVALPCVLLLVIIVRAMYRKTNTKHNHDTLPLRIFKWLARRTYQPVKRAVKSYFRLLLTNWITTYWFELRLFRVF